MKGKKIITNFVIVRICWRLMHVRELLEPLKTRTIQTYIFLSICDVWWREPGLMLRKLYLIPAVHHRTAHNYIVCCGRKQLKLEWIQPLWNQSQGLKPHLCDAPSGSIGFPFWTLGDHSVQPLALKQDMCSETGLRSWMANRSHRASRTDEKRERLFKQHMVVLQPSSLQSLILVLHIDRCRDWKAVSAESRWEEEMVLWLPSSKTILSMKVECVGHYKTQIQPPKLRKPGHL